MTWFTKLAGMLKEPNGKVSMSRVNLFSSLLAFWLVFVLWFGATAGLFFNLWPWSRFEGAIVAGGLGLLGVVFGAGGTYAVNKYAASRKVDDGLEDRWAE